MKTILMILLIPFLLTNIISAQEETPKWSDLVNIEKPNFYDIQKAFYAEAEKSADSLIDGYKQFHRFEWYWENRINEDGSFPEGDKIANEYIKYFSKHKSNYGSWVNFGPYDVIPVSQSGVGRVNCIEFYPGEEEYKALVGTPGGIWKCNNVYYNSGWEPLTDFLPNIKISSIAIDPINTSIIYAGTGDVDGFFGDLTANGILKSVDGGDTWFYINNDAEGILKSRSIRKIIVNPVDNNKVIAVSGKQIYKSENAGALWKIVFTSPAYYIRDIEISLQNENNLYISCKDLVYKSSDFGENWEFLYDFWASYIEFSTTPANENIIGICVSANPPGETQQKISIYKYHENENNMELKSSYTSNINVQSGYNFCFNIDRYNEDKMFVGGIDFYYTFNSGVNWEVIPYVSNKLHADVHDIKTVKIGIGTLVFAATDGGIYMREPNNYIWSPKSKNLAISQIYNIGNVSETNNFLCGFQDNGSNVYNYTNNSWTAVSGGDGMECMGVGGYYFTTMQEAYFYRNHQGYADFDLGFFQSRCYTSDYVDPNYMYFGINDLYRSTNILTDNIEDISLVKIFDTPASIKDIEFRAYNCAYLIDDNKNLYKTKNIRALNPTFELMNNNYRFIDIALSSSNTIYGILNLNGVGQIYKSTDSGVTFEEITDDLPGISFNCIIVDSFERTVYLGTDIGVFYRTNVMDEWLPFSNGLPNVMVTELEFNKSLSMPKLRASTFGRGVWETDLACYNYNIEEDILVDEISDSYFFQALNNLSSNVVLPVNEPITFLAGNKITLMPGFSTSPNSFFKAVISSCGNSKSTENRQEVIQNLFINSSSTTKINSEFEEYPDLEVYPNPVSSFLNVNSLNEKFDEIKVLDLIGNIVFENKFSNTFSYQLDLTFLYQGVYFIKINTDTDVKIYKFIKI